MGSDTFTGVGSTDFLFCDFVAVFGSSVAAVSVLKRFLCGFVTGASSRGSCAAASATPDCDLACDRRSLTSLDFLQSAKYSCFATLSDQS